MKISCLPVTFFAPIFRDKSMTREDWFTIAADVGLDGTEIYETWTEGMDEGKVRELGAAARDAGVAVSMYSCENNFSGGEQSEQATAQVRHAVDSAVLLDCDVVRVTAVTPFGATAFDYRKLGDYDRDDLVKSSALGLKGCLDYAADHGVHLALEDHPIIGSFVEEYMKILEIVDDDRLKVNFDTSNFSPDTIVDFARQVAHLVVHTHIKDRKDDDHACYMGTGEVDFYGIFKHFKAAGYDRWLSLEVMGGGKEKLVADHEYITGVWNSA